MPNIERLKASTFYKEVKSIKIVTAILSLASIAVLIYNHSWIEEFSLENWDGENNPHSENRGKLAVGILVNLTSASIFLGLSIAQEIIKTQRKAMASFISLKDIETYYLEAYKIQFPIYAILICLTQFMVFQSDTFESNFYGCVAHVGILALLYFYPYSTLSNISKKGGWQGGLG